MQYEWDEKKRQSNMLKHGVDFALAKHFIWCEVKTWVDSRKDYEEARFVSIAPVAMRLYTMIWTVRGNNKRLISLRKANSREVRQYEQTD